VYNEHGMAQRNGTGMFPRAVMNRFPLLPLEEELRLNDMPLTLLKHHLNRYPVPEWVHQQVSSIRLRRS
jgi:hypothetical protein